MIKSLLAAMVLFSFSYGGGTISNKSLFEDTFSLYALDAQMHHNYARASVFFAELYKQTAKKEYLYQSLRMLEYSQDVKILGKKMREALAASPNDEMLKRFEIITLLKEGKYAEASQKSLLLSEGANKASDYLLYAEARLKLSDFRGAYSALKKAYELNYDNTTAERIGLLQYVQLGEKKEAIQFLKEHIGINGNSIVVGKRLASFYADSGDFAQAAETYEQVYDAFKDMSSVDEAVKIYIYLQDIPKLTRLLERSEFNDPLLLDLYVRVKDFSKASVLARTLYEREDNPLYLAQSAVYRYEGSSDRNDSLMLSNVLEELKKASEDLEEPLYLNYLGYLMIDHDLGINEGMKYVERALEKQPDSPYYIDSLAWGKYKLGECEEALRLIQKVETMVGNGEEEVNEHLKAIKTCKPKEKQK